MNGICYEPLTIGLRHFCTSAPDERFLKQALEKFGHINLTEVVREGDCLFV